MNLMQILYTSYYFDFKEIHLKASIRDLGEEDNANINGFLSFE